MTAAIVQRALCILRLWQLGGTVPPETNVAPMNVSWLAGRAGTGSQGEEHPSPPSPPWAFMPTGKRFRPHASPHSDSARRPRPSQRSQKLAQTVRATWRYRQLGMSAAGVIAVLIAGMVLRMLGHTPEYIHDNMHKPARAPPPMLTQVKALCIIAQILIHELAVSPTGMAPFSQVPRASGI